MEGIQIHDFAFDKLIDWAADATGEVLLKTPEGDVLNLKSQLTQILALSGALGQSVIREATIVCENPEDESRLFRLNLYR